MPASWEVGLPNNSDWQSRWIESAPAAAGTPIVVEQASYETVDGTTTRDVTAILRNLVRDGRLNVALSNQLMGGDPAENKTKRLRLRYHLGMGPSTEQFFRRERRDCPSPPTAALPAAGVPC